MNFSLTSVQAINVDLHSRLVKSVSDLLYVSKVKVLIIEFLLEEAIMLYTDDVLTKQYYYNTYFNAVSLRDAEHD
jgi:hypothetical protein